jgi:hypothetical protein
MNKVVDTIGGAAFAFIMIPLALVGAVTLRAFAEIERIRARVR